MTPHDDEFYTIKTYPFNKVQKQYIEKDFIKPLRLEFYNAIKDIPEANIWTDNMIEDLKELKGKYSDKEEKEE
jgi:hypothetical protein